MINHHTQLLNHLIAKYGLKSYLEIGVNNPAHNFNKIPLFNKSGVDPAISFNPSIWPGTSDEYFKSFHRYWDLIFIDGLHHADQVKRDFENSLRCLSDNGFIVIHDTCPQEEKTTCVPRGEQKVWHGDVYKFAMTLNQYDGIAFETYNFDCGCTVVWKDASKKATITKYASNWETYQACRMEALNIKPFAE